MNTMLAVTLIALQQAAPVRQFVDKCEGARPARIEQLEADIRDLKARPLADKAAKEKALTELGLELERTRAAASLYVPTMPAKPLDVGDFGRPSVPLRVVEVVDGMNAILELRYQGKSERVWLRGYPVGAWERENKARKKAGKGPLTGLPPMWVVATGRKTYGDSGTLRTVVVLDYVPAAEAQAAFKAR